MASNDKEIFIRINAVADKAIKELQRLRKSVDDSKSATEKTGTAFTKFGAKLGAARKGVSDFVFSLQGLATGSAVAGTIKGLDAMFTRSQKLQGVMNNLPFPIGKAQAAARGLADEFTLAQNAVRAATLGAAKTEKEFTKLTDAATKLAIKQGLDVNKAIDDFTTALSRASPMILDNLGLTVKVSEANEQYAAAIGKSVSQLTDAEKAEAFRAAAMKAAEEQTKGVRVEVDAATEAWMRFKTQAIDLVNDSVVVLTKSIGFLSDSLNEMVESLVASESAAQESFFLGGGGRSGSFIKNANMGRTNQRGAPAFLSREANESLAAENARRDAEAARQAHIMSVTNAAMARAREQQESRKGRVGHSSGSVGSVEFIRGGVEPAGLSGRAAIANQSRIAEEEQLQLRKQEAMQLELETARQLRDIEIQRFGAESSEQKLALFEQEIAAQQRLLDARMKAVTDPMERAELADQKAALHHKLTLERMKQAASQQKTLDKVVDETSKTISAYGNAFSMAAKLAGDGSKAAVAFQAAAGISEMTILAIRETANAAAAYASLNIPMGIAHTAAAALAVASAVKIGVEAGQSGGGASARTEAGPRQAFGPSGGAARPSRPTNDSGVPISPVDGRPGARGPAANQKPGNTVVIQNAQFLGSTPAEVGQGLKRAIREADMQFGEAV